MTGRLRGLFLVGALLSLDVLADAATVAVVPVRAPRVKGANKCSPSLMGDPVLVSGTSPMSWDRMEDFRLKLPNGEFSFFRTFFGDRNALGSVAKEVTQPADCGQPLTSYWPAAFRSPVTINDRTATIHSLQAVVDTHCPLATRVLTTDGDVRFFGPTPSIAVGQSAWVPRLVGEGAGEPSRLQVRRPALDQVWFDWFSESGEVLRFRRLGGDVPEVARLVAQVPEGGTKGYELTYAWTAGGHLVPYRVDFPDTALHLRLEHLAGGELSRIELVKPAAPAELVSVLMVYQGTNANAHEPFDLAGGWLDALSGFGWYRKQSLTSLPTMFETRFVHYDAASQYSTGATARTTEGWREEYSSAEPRTDFVTLSPPTEFDVPAALPMGATCGGQFRQQRSSTIHQLGGAEVVSHTFELGALERVSQPASTGGFRESGDIELVPRGVGADLGPQLMSVSKACVDYSPASGVCVPWTVAYYYGSTTSDGSVDLQCGAAPAHSHLLAVADRLGSVTIEPRSFNPRYGGVFEKREIREGASAPTATDALRTQALAYDYRGAVQQLSEVSEASVLSPSQRARTSFRHDAKGRLEAIIRTGFTRRVSDGAVVEQHRAVFIRRGLRCATGVIEPRGRERPSSVEGPCRVASPTATSCLEGEGSWPITDLFYYGTRGPVAYLPTTPDSFDDGRLAAMRTYSGGCGSEFFDVRWGQYNARGEWQLRAPPSGPVQRRTLPGELPSYESGPSSAVHSTASAFTWEQGRLKSVVSAGGSWTACYASSAASAIVTSRAEGLVSLLSWPEQADYGFPRCSHGSNSAVNVAGAPAWVGRQNGFGQWVEKIGRAHV